MEALVLHLLDRCRDHFHCVCLAEPADETKSYLLTPLFIARCRVAMRCVQAVSISLFDGPIAATTDAATEGEGEGLPVGLFAVPGDALPRLPSETPSQCSDIISYLHWVHSSFKALAPILAQSSTSPHNLTTTLLAVFARQQLPLLIAAWQRIIIIITSAATALFLSPPYTEKIGGYNDSPAVRRHGYRSGDQTPVEDCAMSLPHCSQQLQSCPPSPPPPPPSPHPAEAVLDVCRRSVQVRRRGHR